MNYVSVSSSFAYEQDVATRVSPDLLDRNWPRERSPKRYNHISERCIPRIICRRFQVARLFIYVISEAQVIALKYDALLIIQGAEGAGKWD